MIDLGTNLLACLHSGNGVVIMKGGLVSIDLPALFGHGGIGDALALCWIVEDRNSAKCVSLCVSSKCMQLTLHPLTGVE